MRLGRHAGATNAARASCGATGAPTAGVTARVFPSSLVRAIFTASDAQQRPHEIPRENRRSWLQMTLRSPLAAVWARATAGKRVGHGLRHPMEKMSLSANAGPYFGRTRPPRLQNANLKAAAATEVTAAACVSLSGSPSLTCVSQWVPSPSTSAHVVLRLGTGLALLRNASPARLRTGQLRKPQVFKSYPVETPSNSPALRRPQIATLIGDLSRSVETLTADIENTRKTA